MTGWTAVADCPHCVDRVSCLTNWCALCREILAEEEDALLNTVYRRAAKRKLACKRGVCVPR